MSKRGSQVKLPTLGMFTQFKKEIHTFVSFDEDISGVIAATNSDVHYIKLQENKSIDPLNVSITKPG